MRHYSEDTIAAIATPPGEGGIGIIRVSGPLAFPIAARIFQRAHGKNNTGEARFESHRIYFGTILDPETGERLDRALLLPFRAPHSYTGEDVVEFSCHGSPLVLQRVLRLIWREGARPAQPGEFTQRAFLNGKLDLAQAEAVADLIRARTESQLRAALYLHEGALSRTVRTLNDALLALLAEVEAAIDFSEEIGELDRETLAQRLQQLIEQLTSLLQRAQAGRLLREGVRVAIVGRPNVGKSSLLNALLGEERAIVTPIPGTTRDLIEEAFQIRGVPIVVLDTAGLRENPDPVEQIGIERTRRAIEHADLLLVVLDISEGLTDADRVLLETLPDNKPRIIVWNKADLVSDDVPLPSLPGVAVRVSALWGDGLTALCEAILQGVNLSGVGEESLLLTHQRHQQAVEEARRALISALQATNGHLPPDIIAVDLRAAWLALGAITGETVDDELIHRIFRDFCIGK
jgi:tRNA modification GTPase